MEKDLKVLETASAPYHLNINNTAKDFSSNESTNPETGLLDTLTKYVLVDNNIEIQPIYIINNPIYKLSF